VLGDGGVIRPGINHSHVREHDDIRSAGVEKRVVKYEFYTFERENLIDAGGSLVGIQRRDRGSRLRLIA